MVSSKDLNQPQIRAVRFLPTTYLQSTVIQIHRTCKGLISSPSGSLGGRVQREVQHTTPTPGISPFNPVGNPVGKTVLLA